MEYIQKQPHLLYFLFRLTEIGTHLQPRNTFRGL